MKKYHKNSVLHNVDTDTEEQEHPKVFCTRPTQTLLQKWLREIHKIDIYIIRYGFGYYAQLNNVPPANQGNVKYIDRRWNMPPKDENSGNLRIYEDALEVGLLEALKIITNGIK